MFSSDIAFTAPSHDRQIEIPNVIAVANGTNMLGLVETAGRLPGGTGVDLSSSTRAQPVAVLCNGGAEARIGRNATNTWDKRRGLGYMHVCVVAMHGREVLNGYEVMFFREGNAGSVCPRCKTAANWLAKSLQLANSLYRRSR